MGAAAHRLTDSPIESAQQAGCRYVDDAAPGIRRVRRGRGFVYIDPRGHTVEDPETLERIRKIAIPPAWTNVWISPLANGHIQATGRDARGRKQYRYHERFRAARDERKYDRLVEFAEALPRIRAAIDADLDRARLERPKVLATVVRLLELTLIRVGNEEYARENRSYGLTTLRSRHVDVAGSTIRFRFRGKSKKEHEVSVSDRRLAKIVQRCLDLPGEEIFEYVDEEGSTHRVESADVNEYLGRVAGGDFTAKDFRTWAGTVLAARALAEIEAAPHGPSRTAIAAAIKGVAERLGNTKAVCERCYVHPLIIRCCKEGSLARALATRETPKDRRRRVAGASRLSSDERAVLALLRRSTSHRQPSR